MIPVIALFDLDGVLIHPGGYRESFKRTMDIIIERMGIIFSYPGTEMVELYEANLLNTEWDMLPITLAILLEYIYQENQSLSIASGIEMAIEQIAGAQNKWVNIDFPKILPVLSKSFRKAEIPSLSLFQAIEKEESDIPFKRLKSSPLLKKLLGTTRDIQQSYPNRLFQNLVLGSDRFTETYSLPSIIRCESLLEKYDCIQPSIEKIENLKYLTNSGNFHPAVMTFRPSLPPKEIQEKLIGFSPEAELATSLLGFRDFPIIGYGRIRYLAEYLHLLPDQLIKPSPIQALAGIIAAWTKNEWNSLLQASQVCLRPNPEIVGEKLNELPLPNEFELHVFEDTINGILSAIAAKEILARLGYHIHLVIWGITSNSAKAETLGQLEMEVYKDINEALTIFFSHLK